MLNNLRIIHELMNVEEEKVQNILAMIEVVYQYH